MKKLVFKKWVEDLVVGIGTIAFMLIIMSVESDWTLEYFIFLAINFGLVGISALLVRKFGRKNYFED